MTKIHAKFGSPSSLERTKNCPGWITFGKDLPELPAGEYAIEGDWFHSLMEQATPQYFIDQTVLPKVLEDAKRYDGMGECIDFTLERLFFKWTGFLSKHDNANAASEMKIYITKDIFGTADFVMWGRNKKTKKMDIVVVDYKHGRGVPVVAEENLQIIAYLIGAINTLKLHDIGVAMGIIAQVRLENGWTDYSIPGRFLDGWEEKIKAIVHTAKEMFAGERELALSAGEHCRFCKCAGVCPELKRQTFDMVSRDLDQLPLESLVQRLTMDEQVKIFLQKGKIEDFLSAVAKNLALALQSGFSHPDVKLITTKGRRSWGKDVTGKDLIALGIAEPYKPAPLKGTTEIRKVAKKAGISIEHLVVAGEGKTELVASSDNREGLEITEMEELE